MYTNFTNSGRKEILHLHIAVMLFSLAGVVAQFVEISSVLVAFGRVLCSSVLLFLIILFRKETFRLSRSDFLFITLTGGVLALHWTSFFQSIQVSTVAIGTITFSTFPLFITFLEPVFFHEKLQKQDILSAFLLLLGVFITIPEFSIGNQDTLGILWGMLSSVTYAVMTLANRYFSRKYDGKLICFYEQGFAAAVLFPFMFIIKADWKPVYLLSIAFVGFVCTAFGYTLYVSAQKKVRAQTAGIISGMETVYGIAYAFLLLGEIPSLRELTGGAVILGTALYPSIRQKPVTCNIEHHAMMFAFLAKHAIQQCKEAGKESILRGMTVYGNERGARMAANALAHGDELNTMTSQAYGEWKPDYDGQMEFGRLRTEPTFQTYISKCAWCDAWKKHGITEYGKYYCVNVDHAVYQGFRPDFVCTPTATALSWGGSRCEFDWGHPLSPDDVSELEAKKTELGSSCMKDFTFHTAHLKYTLSKALEEDLGAAGKEIVSLALADYEKTFGREYLTALDTVDPADF